MKFRILLADDDASARAEARRVLEDTFDIIGEVSDGAQAVEACLADPPDVLVLDIAMPRMSGLDVIREIRRQLGARPAIVVVSGIAEEVIALEALEAGADEYLVKPFSAEALVRAVRGLARAA